MLTPPQIELASISMPDTLVLMVLALVVFGPRRLPQIGRQIGKLMYEFRKASNDFKFQMEEELRLSEDADRRKKEDAERLQVAAVSSPATVEAQADIGALEPPVSETVASPYPGEATYPPPTEPPATYPPAMNSAPVDATQAGAAEVVGLGRVVPVIQPPSTGEPVAAARYGALRVNPEPAGTPVTPEANAPEATIGAEPATTPGPDSMAPGTVPPDSNRSESVSHHG